MDIPLDLQHAARSICRWMTQNNVTNWRFDHLASRDELERAEKELTELRAEMKEKLATQKAYYESVFEDGARRIAKLTEQWDVATEFVEEARRSGDTRLASMAIATLSKVEVMK